MEKIIKKFDKTISYVLLAMGMFFVSFQTLELVWEVGKGFVNRIQAGIALDYAPEYFKNVIVLFFNILLLLEILETIKVFDKSHEIKIRVILIVCLIAVSRKILLMDTHESNPAAELAVAALILAFSTGYFLVTRYGREKSEE